MLLLLLWAIIWRLCSLLFYILRWESLDSRDLFMILRDFSIIFSMLSIDLLSSRKLARMILADRISCAKYAGLWECIGDCSGACWCIIR